MLLEAEGYSQNTLSCPLCAGQTLVHSCSVGAAAAVRPSAAGRSAAQGSVDTRVASRQMFRMSLRGPGEPCVHDPAAFVGNSSHCLAVLWVSLHVVDAGGIDLAEAARLGLTRSCRSSRTPGLRSLSALGRFLRSTSQHILSLSLSCCFLVAFSPSTPTRTCGIHSYKLPQKAT